MRDVITTSALPLLHCVRSSLKRAIIFFNVIFNKLYCMWWLFIVTLYDSASRDILNWDAYSSTESSGRVVSFTFCWFVAANFVKLERFVVGLRCLQEHICHALTSHKRQSMWAKKLQDNSSVLFPTIEGHMCAPSTVLHVCPRCDRSWAFDVGVVAASTMYIKILHLHMY